MSARGEFGPSGDFRGPHLGHGQLFGHDRGFGHHRFFGRGHSFFFFDFGYPFYDYPDYYYDYPPPYYYYYPAYPYSGTSYPAPVDGRTYLVLGHDWGKDLRLDIVAWNQFVTYVKAYITNAPAGARDDFRRGFVSGYGRNAEATFAKAVKAARASEPKPAASQSSDFGENHH
ncbi:MAG TPA: hypothetical protein VL486_15410 [Verrucomicrobiae bacterium]|nr:hypothetical protein [Verrucomicrobiae bacterium]